jgi:hypothetical protein
MGKIARLEAAPFKLDRYRATVSNQNGVPSPGGFVVPKDADPLPLRPFSSRDRRRQTGEKGPIFEVSEDINALSVSK